ncbi:hypothetical protein ACFYOT_34975 [Saccharothrix saharensis]|uniref:hypothetical protein n=1 Tax=Saccharothrix saharensis TaxID=571190 RepID=UPI0036878043
MRLDGEQHMVKAMRRAVLAAAPITAATTAPVRAATVVVADGTGNHRTVQAAVNAIAAGTTIPSGKTGSTVTINGVDTTVRAPTVKNDYAETGSGSEQAVAPAANRDRQVHDNVRVLGDQDTRREQPANHTTQKYPAGSDGWNPAG